MSIVNEGVRKFLIDAGYAQKSWSVDADNLWTNAAQSALDDGKLTAEKLAELQSSKSPSARDVFGGARVKRPSERYSNSKSVALHAKSGKSVLDERGREVQTVSELEHAKAGVIFKRAAQRSGLPVQLSEHERELEADMFENDLFCGKLNGEYQTGIPGSHIKALLSDNTSGGESLNPEWFDSAVVQYPLLHSELLPKVDLVNVPRGSSVEGAAVGNPSVVWNVAEGTAMTAFTTTSLVTGIDTAIFPVSCVVEIGRDFLSDSAVDIGRILVENVGQSLLTSLDTCIAVGDGTTQPQGLFTAPSTIDIGVPVGGNGAAPQVNDYEALLFGISKPYRNKNLRPCYLANDVSYLRCRSIPTGGANETRIFGMNHESYQLFGHDFLINNSIPNTKAGFAAMAKCRLYRRQMQEIRFESGGKELSTKNLTMLIVRGRYGGKLVDANAFAFSDNFQT